MTEATQMGAESLGTTDNAPDPDTDLINVLNGDGQEADDQIVSDDDAEQKPAVETYTVKINGQEKSVTRDELIAHYQKAEAAQEKFEQAAAIRREAEQQRTVYEQQQAQLAQAIQHFQQQAQLLMSEGEPNWQELLQNNPHEYLIQRERWGQKQQALQQAQAAQAYLGQQQQAQQFQALQTHLAQEATRLTNDYLPEWADKSVREKEEAELIGFLREKGYNDQDLMNLNHSRASNIALAVSAMRYERLLAKAKAAKKPAPPEAANPVPTVSGKAGAMKDPTQMSDAEFAKWRQSQRTRR